MKRVLGAVLAIVVVVYGANMALSRFAGGAPAVTHGVPQTADVPADSSAHQSSGGVSASPSPAPSRVSPRATSTFRAITATSAPARTIKPVSIASPAQSYLVLIVLDGAQPGYLSVPGIPHVRALMRSGTQYTNAWAGILESETPSGHAALSSGSNPSTNGVLSFDWASGDNVPVNLFDPAKIRAGDMERIMRAAGAPSVAEAVQAADPRAKVVALSGHKYYAADAMGGPDADVIMYYTGTPDGRFVPQGLPGHMPPSGILTRPELSYHTSKLPTGVEDHLTMQLAQQTFARLHQRVTMINVPEFDWPLGHVQGGTRDPREVEALMQAFDHDLASLEDEYRRAGILDRTTFVLTADHGMAPIYHKVPEDLITQAVSAAGTSIIDDTMHTAAYLWLKDESRAVLAAENIARAQNPYIQAVYFRSKGPGGYVYLRASGSDLFRDPGMEAANQHLMGTFSSSNSPDLVVQLAEGAGIEPGGQAGWKGDHGGSSWQSQHFPLVLSGSGIGAGRVSDQPARLIDIAPTVLNVMGVPATRMQGTVLADALQRPAPGALKKERALRTRLLPIVAALRHESSLDLAAGR